jgi:hypothetical protein
LFLNTIKYILRVKRRPLMLGLILTAKQLGHLTDLPQYIHGLGLRSEVGEFPPATIRRE